MRTTLPNSSRETTLRREKTGRISLYFHYHYAVGQPRRFWLPGLRLWLRRLWGLPLRRLPHHENRIFLEGQRPDSEPDHANNLLLATSDNAGAQQLLFDSRRYQQITVASYVAGGGLLAYGLLQSLRSTNGSVSISPLVYAALPVLIIPIVLQGKQANNQRQAISLYNATQ